MIARAALALAATLPGLAMAEGLDCSFTTLCSPQTDCQSHEGVPFALDVLSGAFAYHTAEGPVFGTPLSHMEPPAIGLLFDTTPNTTILLTVTPSGEAVMAQHDLSAGNRLNAVTYYGTCEPSS